MKKRVFLIVLDSFGCGELPDAAKFGDTGSHTLRALVQSGKLHAPNLQKLGIFFEKFVVLFLFKVCF